MTKLLVIAGLMVNIVTMPLVLAQVVTKSMEKGHSVGFKIIDPPYDND